MNNGLETFMGMQVVKEDWEDTINMAHRYFLHVRERMKALPGEVEQLDWQELKQAGSEHRLLTRLYEKYLNLLKADKAKEARILAERVLYTHVPVHLLIDHFEGLLNAN